ncbi:hypothetical protein SEA_LILMARTIN_217 [Streptomyces phage LilMartin]|nr:hypothetical protein SEA_LILMARTIN_217 [Streptomyces phage LilMartin]QNO12605.1 hypothetical protein SEA_MULCHMANSION_221 [Streptomyces phage MulchMansion]UVK61272.1 rIIA-like protein [Streptomyces phage Angela]
MEPTAIYAERKGNLAGETVAMSVDAASMAHVMSILTDLYSDPVLAVIREYSTNAFDSHVEAGVQRPIEVSLPNGLSPFFKVRDYGVGLSVEDIRNVYSKYGASTKRSTNEQVGMLGLGCKSALTYTQQFTVRSVKDGMLAYVAISRTEDGSGVMQVVHTKEVDEPNGVEISVPVHDMRDFEWKARDFFRFWEPGTVLIDEQEPDYIDGNDLGDGIKVIKSGQTDYVVMGNVGYRVSNEHALYKDRYGMRGRNFGIVARVAIGSVNFTPSREDLHYTERTIETLQTVRDIVRRRLMDKAQESIEAKPTRAEARQEWLEWRQMTGQNLSELTYKGDRIPSELNVRHIRYRPDYGRGSTGDYSSLNFNEVGRCIFIHGYEKDEISTSHRAKMRLWADQKGFSGRQFIVTKEPVEQKWFESTQVGTWEEVFATKKPREPRGQVSETYSIAGPGQRYPYQTTLAEIDKTKTLIVWSSGDERHEDVIGQVVSLHGNALSVKLPKNRWDKFLRENSQAIKMTDILPHMVAKAFAALSDDEKLSMSIDYYDRNPLMVLNPARIDDPELVRYTRVVQSIKKTDAIEHFNAVSSVCSRLFIDRPTVDKVESPKVKYPLLAAVTGYASEVLEHFYLYANTVYAKENETNV